MSARAQVKVPRAGLLIGGEWRAQGSEGEIDVFDPATGDRISAVPSAGAREIDEAVAVARHTFEKRVWTGLSAQERAKILWRIADLIDARGDEIAAIDTLDNGMPLKMSRGLVSLSAETFRFFAGWCTKIYGVTADVSGPLGEFHAYTLREPVGVAGLIVPWNTPFLAACNKVAVALAAGCSCVLKPAEEAPLSALVLADIVKQAGVPDGVLNVVIGLGETAGAALVAHPDVDKVGFTGSTEVGRKIIQAAAGNFKRLTLELGGKSPVLVMNDADLDAAAPGVARGVYSNSGQACIAGSRVFVQSGIFDAFVAKLKQTAQGFRVGNGFDDNIDMGPLISDRQRKRVQDLVRSGQQDGADLLLGGSERTDPGYFVDPTILLTPRPDARVLREEIFGPVVTVLKFDDPEEAIASANDTEFGLAAAVWSRDIKQAHRLAKRLRAGTVWLNCQLVTNRSMPFGGYKQSGWGRESAWQGIEAYLETKSVFAAL